MPSQRPFFSSFFSAFRVHSLYKSAASAQTSPSAAAAPSSGTSASIASQAAHASASTAASSAPRTIASAAKPPTSPLSAAAAAAFSPPGSRHPSAPNAGTTPRPIARSPNPAFSSPRRRGSDTSSDSGGGGGSMASSTGTPGFKDALGGEKWFIGGRTAAGEERFYKLAMVRRERSGDRASLDRMSL